MSFLNSRVPHYDLYDTRVAVHANAPTGLQIYSDISRRPTCLRNCVLPRDDTIRHDVAILTCAQS